MAWFIMKLKKKIKKKNKTKKEEEKEEEEQYAGINPIAIEREQRRVYTDYVDRVLSSTVFDPDDLRMMSVSK